MVVILDEIDKAEIDFYWKVLEPHFVASCERVTTTLTAARIKANITAGLWKAWAIYDRDTPVPILAAAATSIRETNKGLTVVIESIGGHDMRLWFASAMSAFEVLAKAHGMVRIEIEGRRGWERKLPGFQVARVIMEKTL